jgi:hypothetical protein
MWNGYLFSVQQQDGRLTKKKFYMLRLHQLAPSKLILDVFRKLWLSEAKRKQSLFPAGGINTIDLTANLQPFDKRSLA